MSLFSIAFDQASLSEIAQFYGFQTLLTQSVQMAMKNAGDLLVQAAQDNTWAVFDHPTGALASSIGVEDQGPMEIVIGVGVPYGRRQELGGGGLTDSLGRSMTNPAKPYLQPALDAHLSDVLSLLDAAVENAWAGIK